MKILNLENEGNQEMLQKIKNRVDKYKLCFQEKIQGSQGFLRPLFPPKHVRTLFPNTEILSTAPDTISHLKIQNTSVQDRIIKSY